MRAADQRVPGDFRHPGDPGDRALELFIWEGVGFHRGGTQIRHSAVYPDQRIRHSGGDPAGGAGGLFDSGVPGQAGPAQGEKHDAIGGELAGGIPSVVYGLVGMMVLVPGIRKVFHVPDGASLLAAIIVLAIMILPSIIKVTVTALEAVPAEYEDASLALGATPIETYFRVSVPAAKSGIAAAVVLGVGRAIGEAMAVMMVSGNATSRTPSLFESVRFLTTAVASEMSYSSGLQQQALFSIALVLFLFIMLINAGLNLLLKRNKEG